MATGMRTTSHRACSLACLSLVAAAAAAGCEQKEILLDDDDLVIAEVAPPSISGGTLIVSADEKRAIASDPDRDLVWIVDLTQKKLERSVPLQPGDEPGRLVEDAQGFVHVALRRGAALVTIDPATGTIVRRAPICGAPRGLALDEAKGQIHVACADGKLVTVDPATGNELRRLTLDSDLRDVVVQGDRLLVSRFRSAEVLSIDAAGEIVSRGAPPVATVPTFNEFDGEQVDAHFSPTVAWRMVPWPAGGALVVHQRSKLEEIELETPGGYGDGGCGSIVHGALAQIGVDDLGAVVPPAEAMTVLPAVLPTDVAVSKDGSSFAVAAAGSNTVFFGTASELGYPAAESCGLAGQFVSGTPVAVAFRGDMMIAQTREPAAIELLSEGGRILLPGVSVRDTGHDMFHLPPSMLQQASGATNDMATEPGFPGGSLACASCHPEGGEDSHVWTFQGVGPRRTQSLRGDLLATAPLHWEGDMENVDAIMDEVFTRRMGGQQPTLGQARAIERWVGRIPAPATVRSPEDAAALRGKALFESEAVGCAKCHSGPHLTNNQNASVGRGELLQVPSLVGVAWRAPFMHDGCATTLLDRFDPACGGDQHGDVSGLSEADLGDLVAYLESL